MDGYTAALRISRHDDTPAHFAASAIETVQGVLETNVDRVSGQVLVRFDRARVTIGDLVRWIEDQGLRVMSVAQSRDVGGQAQSASA